MAAFLFFLALVLSNFAHAARPLALESLEPDRSLLVMGGSFSPPTEAHLAAMADLLYEQEFPHGVFLVAKPYKAGAAPAEVSLALTRIGVETFDYVLRRRNIPFRDFRVKGPGQATWISKAGRPVLLEVSSFDIDHQITDSIESIRHFSAQVGARNLWWLAGGDSGASMPTWGPWWTEMFDRTNMIFIGRKSGPGEASIDHTKNDPLNGLYPEEFLARHRYETIDGRVHVYRAEEPGHPSIFVLGKSTLPYSSTLARKSLQTLEQQDAQLMLTPAVYRAIIENTYYSSVRSFLTRENLERYLLDEFRLVEDGRGNIDQYRAFLEALVREVTEKPSVDAPMAPLESPGALPTLGARMTPALADLRNQLVLSDPRFLVSRLRLTNAMALTPKSQVTLNLVKSQMSFDVPLEKRQAADRKNRWYDLNISTNELRATLGNPPLVRALELASRGVEGALANALAMAVQLEPRARLRFEIFTSRRYFNRLALGLVRPEFASELDGDERAFEAWARHTIASLGRQLSPRQLARLGEALGDVYILRRYQGTKEDAFWTEFLNLALTDYPGEFLNLSDFKVAKALARRITLFVRGLQRVGEPNPTRVTYGGRELARYSADEFQLLGPLAQHQRQVLDESRAEGISNLGVISGLNKYFEELGLSARRPFDAIAPAKKSFEFSALRSARTLPAQNLIRDLHFFYADAAHDLDSIRETFEALVTPPPSDLIEARVTALATVASLKTRLETLELEWLKKKMAYPFEKSDAEVPGYARTLEEYLRIQSEFGRAIDRCRAINHVALGMVATLAEAEGLTPTSPVTKATSRELLWREIVGDVIDKYMVSNPEGIFGSNRQAVIEGLGTLSFADLERMKLGEVLLHLVKALNPQRSPSESADQAGQVLAWLNQKYGLLNEVALRPMNREVEGTYRADLGVHYEMQVPRLNPLFDPKATSSLQDLPAYLHRKWGGLRKITRPDRVVFSELGTDDTLKALRARGFDEFFQVNASYAMRGSKTMMAFRPGHADPLVVFHSFIGEDLYQHKLMQLAVDFGADFGKVRALSSNGLKSWDQSRRVLAEAVRQLPDLPVDDLVLGYGEVVFEMLSKSPNARLLREGRLGDFADVGWFVVAGKNGISRKVLVVFNMAYRYFGKSVLPLIQPFLDRGVDRVIFAGSAGVLDPKIPQHGVVVPRTFQLLEDDGTMSARTATHNDLFAHAPFGVGFSGRHVSVPSPLVESRARVTDLRERQDILSVDVEGAQIARLIDEHNAKAALLQVRFASAYIVTDVPAGEDASGVEYGLHQPDFKGKAKAKGLYGSLLKLLWDIPTGMGYSAHTAIISNYYVARMYELTELRDERGLRALRRDVRERLHETRKLLRRGGRVSRGLVRVYGDLVAMIDRSQVLASNAAETPVETIRAVPVRRRVLSKGLERAVMLHSLSRSSTLNSGDVVYNRGDVDADVTRRHAARAAERAVDWVLERRHRQLTVSDALELNRILNRDVLKPKYQEDFARFNYTDESGQSTTSIQLVDEFFRWLSATPPSFETAIQAYVRYEAIHPHKDGSGRTAELIAQHTMLRAGLVPVILPNRFDIDYILSLKRNGANETHFRAYTAALAGETDRFTEALLGAAHGREISSVHFGTSAEGVVITFEDATKLYVQAVFVTDRAPHLEREERLFVKSEELPSEVPMVRIARRQYEVVHLFGEKPFGCEGGLLSTPK